MKKFMIGLTVLAVMSVIVGISIAQSDYSSRAGYSIAKSPQSTPANIHSRMGVMVGHYVYDIDGAVVEDVAFTIKEGEGSVTMPNNAIIMGNTMAYIDITTAGLAGSTGVIAVGSTTLWTGALSATGTFEIDTTNVTKLAADSVLTFTCTDVIPTNALSISVYVPYILGN